MKKSLRLMALALVVIMTLAAISVFAEGEFIQSVTAYSATAIAKKASASGNPDEDIVADIVDKDGNQVEEVQRINLAVVNISDERTEENTEALDGLQEAVKQVEKDGGFSNLLDDESKKELKNSGIDPSGLSVATIFDVSLGKTIPEGATLFFTLQVSAIRSLQKSDNFTGKIVILQENTETGKYEALKEGKKGELKAGEFAVDGDVAEVAVSHLCVFMVAAETVDTTPAKAASTWWIWLLIAIAIVIVIVIIFVVAKKGKKA